MNTRRFILFVFVSASVCWSQAQPPRMEHVNLINRTASNLQSEVGSIASDGKASWTAYAVPTIAPDQQMCCFTSTSGNMSNCGCALERESGHFSGSVEGPGTEHLEPAPYFYVFLRNEGGRVQKVRTFSASCPLDADGMTVYWLGTPRPADSVALLTSFIGAGNQAEWHGDRVADGAMVAIAYTRDPSADQALDRFVVAGQPRSVRKKAAFWIGQMRGADGLKTLLSLMRNDSDDQFRSELTFDISQSKLPEAQAELLRVARQDQSSRVRGQALFWLAQKAGRKVEGAITEAIERDPDTDVKKKAVFALTQMPSDEGIPLLINVAKTNNNPAVRKQAIFWLGQSHDPRALDFIESVLTH